MAGKDNIPDDVWHGQADLFELGFKNASEIARDLGVSPQTASRRMKKMGAVKGCRVGDTLKPLISFLDRKAEREALMVLADRERRARAAEASSKAVGHMIAALLAADQMGDMTLANPLLDRMTLALGGKRRAKR